MRILYHAANFLPSRDHQKKFYRFFLLDTFLLVRFSTRLFLPKRLDHRYKFCFHRAEMKFAWKTGKNQHFQVKIAKNVPIQSNV